MESALALIAGILTLATFTAVAILLVWAAAAEQAEAEHRKAGGHRWGAQRRPLGRCPSPLARFHLYGPWLPDDDAPV